MCHVRVLVGMRYLISWPAAFRAFENDNYQTQFYVTGHIAMQNPLRDITMGLDPNQRVRMEGPSRIGMRPRGWADAEAGK